MSWETSSSVSMGSKSIWGIIWALKVYPRVRNFMWKFPYNILPTKSIWYVDIVVLMLCVGYVKELRKMLTIFFLDAHR